MTHLFDSVPPSMRSTFVREKLGVLLGEHAYRRELLRTLQIYLDSDGCVSEAAKRLYVHRNTLTYRLERLRTMLGCDLKDLNSVMELRLAIEFYRHGISEEGAKTMAESKLRTLPTFIKEETTQEWKECDQCFGCGEDVCPTCDGEGCVSCDRRGYTTCWWCGGVGMVRIDELTWVAVQA